jgi:hypothetical protein
MDMNDLLTRLIKYVVEGVAVALALFFIPRKPLPMDEIVSVTIAAAAVFCAGHLLPLHWRDGQTGCGLRHWR